MAGPSLRFPILFVMLLGTTSQVLSRPTPRVTVQQGVYRGWQGSYRMSNGRVTAWVVPEIGGRIMEYSLDGRNALFENAAEAGKLYPITPIWHNYGGFKNWNAPQDRWGWPPDPYLDFGFASVEILNPSSTSPTLRSTGAVSLAAGLVFRREISMDPMSGDLTVRQVLTNVASHPQEWSVWGITQVPYPCIVALPLNPGSPFKNRWEPLSDGKAGEVSQWRSAGSELLVRPAGKVGKIGVDDTAGWMACFRGPLAYVQRLPPRAPGEVYPDQGANAEVYTNGRDLPYLEMEQLGPLANIPPGGSIEIVATWQLRLLDRPVQSDTDTIAALRALGLS